MLLCRGRRAGKRQRLVERRARCRLDASRAHLRRRRRGGKRARVRGLNGVAARDERRERPQHRGDVLVAAEPGDEREAARQHPVRAQGGGERGGGGRVVRAVHQRCAEALVAPRPVDRVEAGAGIRRGWDFAQPFQRPEDRERGDGVFAVERASERKAAGNLAFVGEVGGVDERRAKFRRAARDDFAHGGLVGAEDDRDAGLDDPRLLRGDFLDGVAEPVAVVESDPGDHRNGGDDEIGGVKPSAESAFDDGEGGAETREEDEGDGGQSLEISEPFGARGGENGVRGGSERVIAHCGAVDEEAFVDADEVGAGVAGDGGEGTGAERRVEDGGNGALPVGAGDVDGRKRALGAAERSGDGIDRLEAGTHPEPRAAGEVVEEALHRTTTTAAETA